MIFVKSHYTLSTICAYDQLSWRDHNTQNETQKK
jgi:hypothetical protein